MYLDYNRDQIYVLLCESKMCNFFYICSRSEYLVVRILKYLKGQIHSEIFIIIKKNLDSKIIIIELSTQTL
jgi:hypothetical protein